MVSGVAWTAVFLLGDSLVRYVPLGFIGRAIRKGSIQAPVLDLLVVGAMVAIMAIAVLHAIQSQRSLRRVALASLATFVGLAMYLVGYGVAYARDDFFAAFPDTIFLVVLGLLVATVGLVALGIVTMNARVLPWWGGAALIAGSPPLRALMAASGSALGCCGLRNLPSSAASFRSAFAGAVRRTSENHPSTHSAE